jgi:hypothetical protein
LAAVQPLDEAKTALHLAIAGPSQDRRGAGQKKVARWAQELRRDLEQHSIASTVTVQTIRETVS